MSVVGIDFGDETAKVAVAKGGGIEVVLNAVGKRKSETMVGFNGPQRFLAEEAGTQQPNNLANTVTSIKRFLGRSWNDADMQRELPFVFNKVVDREGKVAAEVQYDDKAQAFWYEQTAGAVLSKLKAHAELGSTQKVSDCVIAVPVWWTDAQRRAMADAAAIAGLNVLRLVNENAAIALQYAMSRAGVEVKEEKKILLVDMGHAHTTATVVDFPKDNQTLSVLGVGYDQFLGGRDFDLLLYDHFAADIKQRYKLDVATNNKARYKLLKESNRLKQMLSVNTRVPWSIEYFMNDTDVKGVIERPTLEELAAQSLLPRLIKVLQTALDSAGLKKEDLSAVEIVGGGVRMPMVQKAIEDFFGKPPSKTLDGDESVAKGAAWMCAMISPVKRVGKPFEVKDVALYPITATWGPPEASLLQEAGVTMGPGANSALNKEEESGQLFFAKTVVPLVRAIRLKDRTEPFQLTCAYSEPQNLPHGMNPLIGKFLVYDIPQPKADAPAPIKLKVRVRLDMNTILSVSEAQAIETLPEVEKAAPSTPSAPMDTSDEKAKEAADAAKSTEEVKYKTKKHEIKVYPKTSGMEQKTLSLCFEREAQMLDQDRQISETQNARNALESYVLHMRNEVSDSLKDYIAPGDAECYSDKLRTTEEWLYDEGENAQKSEYKKRLAELKQTGDAMEHRKQEREERPIFIERLQGVLARYSQLAKSAEEKYAHIPAEDRQKLQKEIHDTERWLHANISEQDKLSPADNPVLTCELIRQRGQQLEQFGNSIMNKPKPKPAAPKKEEPKQEAPAAGAEQPKAEEPKPADMDTSAS